MAVVDLRYGRALAQVVEEQKLDLGQVRQQLDDFMSTLNGSPELKEVLDNPSIPEPQKLRVLDAVSERLNMDRAIRNFIALVAHHGRVLQLGDLVAAYYEASEKDAGIAEAEITSAFPLDAGARQQLEFSIGKLAGGDRVMATYREDPALLGGAVVKLGSTVYDGSVRAQLEAMKQKLMSTAR